MIRPPLYSPIYSAKTSYFNYFIVFVLAFYVLKFNYGQIPNKRRILTCDAYYWVTRALI